MKEFQISDWLLKRPQVAFLSFTWNVVSGISVLIRRFGLLEGSSCNSIVFGQAADAEHAAISKDRTMFVTCSSAVLQCVPSLSRWKVCIDMKPFRKRNDLLRRNIHVSLSDAFERSISLNLLVNRSSFSSLFYFAYS